MAGGRFVALKNRLSAVPSWVRGVPEIAFDGGFFSETCGDDSLRAAAIASWRFLRASAEGGGLGGMGLVFTPETDDALSLDKRALLREGEPMSAVRRASLWLGIVYGIPGVNIPFWSRFAPNSSNRK